jgi:hypothetical protein
MPWRLQRALPVVVRIDVVRPYLLGFRALLGLAGHALLPDGIVFATINWRTLRKQAAARLQ